MTDDRLTYVHIRAIRTVDPSDWFRTKTSFGPLSPFGIAMEVAVTSSLTQIGLLYDALLQVVNPRDSGGTHNWALGEGENVWEFSSGGLYAVTTIDRYYTDIPLSEPNFLVGTSWVRFDRVTDPMFGPYADKNSGIFFARGSVNVQGADLFAVSQEFPFKVEL
jgi:hypothetical protein